MIKKKIDARIFYTKFNLAQSKDIGASIKYIPNITSYDQQN